MATTIAAGIRWCLIAKRGPVARVLMWVMIRRQCSHSATGARQAGDALVLSIRFGPVEQGGIEHARISPREAMRWPDAPLLPGLRLATLPGPTEGGAGWGRLRSGCAAFKPRSPNGRFASKVVALPCLSGRSLRAAGAPNLRHGRHQFASPAAGAPVGSGNGYLCGTMAASAASVAGVTEATKPIRWLARRRMEGSINLKPRSSLDW